MLRNLKVALTESEIAEKAIKASRIHREITLEKEKKKAVVDGYKTAIAKLEVERDSLLECVRDGAESRMVACKAKRDWKAKKVTIVRTDTDEEVETREMTSEDLQMKLNEDVKKLDATPVPDVDVDQIWLMDGQLCRVVEVTDVGVILRAPDGVTKSMQRANWPGACKFASMPIKTVLVERSKKGASDEATKRVLDVLTSEPMGMGDIIRALADAGDEEIDASQIRKALKALIDSGAVASEGEKRGTKYWLTGAS